MAELSDKFIVKYRQQLYDLSQFMHKHPGGINTLKGLSQADITARFQKAPPHSDAAMYLMREYKVNDGASRRLETAKLKAIELPEQSNSSEEDNNNNHLDESMEHLVDWSKAMLPQIGKITKHYDEWVHKPVDRPLRLFGPWYLEMCTKTPWYIVPMFWLPVISMIIWKEIQNNNPSTFIGFFILGILFWTLLEYTLHRFVFHYKLNSDSHAWICTLHFMIHGLHHKVPFDPLRLVFPPVPGVILSLLIYTPISFFVYHPRIILSGGLFGYLCYDMIHYYLHYGNPRNYHMYHMKRYHYQHHFAHQDLGYGISTPLWDFIFKTPIHLRKLKYQLRWS